MTRLHRPRAPDAPAIAYVAPTLAADLDIPRTSKNRMSLQVPITIARDMRIALSSGVAEPTGRSSEGAMATFIYTVVAPSRDMAQFVSTP